MAEVRTWWGPLVKGVFGAVLFLAGCGGGSSTPSQPLTIDGQPLSQTVPPRQHGHV